MSKVFCEAECWYGDSRGASECGYEWDDLYAVFVGVEAEESYVGGDD